MDGFVAGGRLCCWWTALFLANNVAGWLANNVAGWLATVGEGGTRTRGIAIGESFPEFLSVLIRHVCQ
jgi:hypothetical protein